MGKPSYDLFIDRLDSLLVKEIEELHDLTELLGGDGTIVDADDVKGDLLILKQKMEIYKNVKGMIKKAAIGNDSLDATLIMNLEEKKLFIKLVKFIGYARRIFKRSK